MKKNLLLLMAVMPAIITGGLIYTYGVNVPFWDQWDCPGIVLLKAHAGNLAFGDLLAQHNESRMPFPKIIFLLLAKLTGWNTRYETLLTFMGACLVSLNIYILLKRTSTITFHTQLVLLFLLNLLIFSPMQYMNFLWGMELVNFIPIICISTCLAIVYSNLGDALKFILFSILATISTYSFANGLLCWIIVFPLLIFRTHKKTFDIRWLVLVGISTAILLVDVSVYFYDYSKPTHHPSFLAALFSPLKTALAFLTFIGAPLGEKEQIPSAIFGVILIGLFSAVCVRLFNTIRKGVSIDAYLPWLALGIYSILNGLMVSLGRMDFGVSGLQVHHLFGLSVRSAYCRFCNVCPFKGYNRIRDAKTSSKTLCHHWNNAISDSAFQLWFRREKTGQGLLAMALYEGMPIIYQRHG